MKKNQYNYLNLAGLSGHKEAIICQLSNNFDEDYCKIYSQLNAKLITSLVARYPDHNYKRIKEVICKKFNLKNIVLGSGSEDIIMRLNEIAMEKKWKVNFVVPIFYRSIETFKTRNVQFISEENFLKGDLGNSDAIWLNNPNLFTGKTYEKSHIIKLIKKNPKVIFFLDEAGIFSIIGQWKKYSLLSQCHNYKNLITISSFSKMYGMSGLRAGFATGNNEIIKELEQRSLTFPFTSFTEYFLYNIIVNKDPIESIHKKIRKNKEEVEEILTKYKDIKIIKSLTNCMYLKHTKNLNFYNKLLETGIIGLNLDSQFGIKEKGYIRLTAHSSKKIHKELTLRIKKLLNKIDAKKD